MSTHKKIDAVCIAAAIFTIVLTVLFMNGEALGLASVNDDAGGDMFTANDLNADWDTASATRIALSDLGSTISGNGAYVYDGDVYIAYAGRYVLTGELTDGSIIIDAAKTDKIWVMLDGVTLHCDDDAAIRVEQAGKVFLTLAEGTSSTLSSGEAYKETAAASGVDGVIYSRDDLTINGTGALAVSAAYQHGIVCNDDMVITGGDITISAVQDGIHANDSVRIRNAAVHISAGDDGITVSNDDETAFLYIESGSITIPACYEGLEAIDITIAGGTIDIAATDDGINANGSGVNSVIRITGGEITLTNPSGRDGDGLDSNGSIYIEGGRTLISVSDSGGNCAIDYGSENGGECIVSGGTVIACGGSAMAEGFDAGSPQGFLMYSTTAAAGAVIRLEDSTGRELLSEEIPCSFSSVVLSTPALKVGDTCILSIDGVREQITIDNTSAAAFGPGGMFRGGMQNDKNHDGMFDGQEGRDKEPFAGQNDWSSDAPQGLPSRPDDQEAADMQGMEPPDRMNVPDGASRPDGQRETGERPLMPDSGQIQGQMHPGEDNPSSALSVETWVLLGISVLALLIGLAAAIKIRH